MWKFIVTGARDFVVGALAQAFGEALYEAGYTIYTAYINKEEENDKGHYYKNAA